MITKAAPIVLYVGVASLLIGCGGAARFDYARPFPDALKQEETLDVQVLRRETMLTLTNTSARPMPAGTMWINRQFSKPVDALAIGESATLPLAEFVNEHSEAFRAGGFFATEKPDSIAQVHWEIEGRLIGLVVVGDR